MRAIVIPAAAVRPRVLDILVLQGPPLLGAVFAHAHPYALLTLLAGNLFLMTHVFLLNDWGGLAGDLADPNKAESVFTTRGIGPREMAGSSAVLLAMSLVVFSHLGVAAAGLALAIAILSALYSLPLFDWKGKPLLSSATHLLGGVLHFLLGYVVGHAIDGRGLGAGAFVALVFTAGHLTQEVRDHDGDAPSGIRTNAVRFGPRRTFVASILLFAAALVLFMVLAVLRIVPLPLAAVVLLFPVQLHWSFAALREGLTYASVSRLQARYRWLYAFIGVCIVAAFAIAALVSP